jgi:hypothetical protein
MAESPSHRFGQEIGNLLEEIVEPILRDFCKKHKLFLDVKGSRGKARVGKKVTWEDKYGNVHDLDFVIERYTKHSRNKAQEIQGAILPIAERHEWDRPFLGAVIAGVFTDASVKQMESVGFTVLYISYVSIVKAFKSVGIDVAFDEETEDKVFRRCVRKIEKLPKYKRNEVKNHLVAANKEAIDAFSKKLGESLDKLVDRVVVIPLYGDENVFNDISAAIMFVSNHDVAGDHGEFKKFEIVVRYTNGDAITASFSTKNKAVSFLEYLRT